jgi:hypothetical protein
MLGCLLKLKLIFSCRINLGGTYTTPTEVQLGVLYNKRCVEGYFTIGNTCNRPTDVQL